MSAKERGWIEPLFQQFLQPRHEHPVGVESELSEVYIGMLLDDLSKAIEALDPAAIAGRTLDIGDPPVAKPDEIFGDCRTGLMVGAVNHVEALERFDPAIERQGNAQFPDAVFALAEVGPDHRNPDAAAGEGFDL